MPKQGKVFTPSLAFNHAMVYTREFAASRRFYVDLLGFKVIEEQPPYYARLCSARGDGTLALHALEPGKTLSGSDGVRLYFETKDLDRVCRHLEQAGVRLSQPPKTMPWGWTHAYLNDPDGHEVSLYWAGAKRFQKTKSAK